MDEAGIGRAHLVGNSLGGFVALQLAARGRAESVVALAPARGWATADASWRETVGSFATLHEGAVAAAPHAGAIAATAEGRRRATSLIAEALGPHPRRARRPPGARRRAATSPG